MCNSWTRKVQRFQKLSHTMLLDLFSFGYRASEIRYAFLIVIINIEISITYNQTEVAAYLHTCPSARWDLSSRVTRFFIEVTVENCSRHMDRWIGKVAIVTGASIGIGAAIAEALVNEGVLVIGLARRLDKLVELSVKLVGAKGKLYPRHCDVGIEEDLLDAFKWVKAEFGGVDILVNNAGVYSNKTIIDDDVDGFRDMLNVNVLATAVSIRESVASMRSRNVAGHIIVINSVDGHWLPVGESASLYSASKFSVTAMTETVRRELVAAGTRIKITSVSPGYVKTDIMRAAGVPSHETFFDNVPFLEPKNIAESVVYILSTPENVQVTELSIRPVGEGIQPF